MVHVLCKILVLVCINTYGSMVSNATGVLNTYLLLLLGFGFNYDIYTSTLVS